LLEEIPPRVWAPIRVSAGALLLLGIVRLAGRELPRSGGLLGRLALFSIFGVVINQLLFVEGLARTTPAHSSILMTSTPVWTLLFAVVAGLERARPRRIGSLLVASIGVLLVIRPHAGEPASSRIQGDLLTLGNALSYALFLVISKRTLSRTDALGAAAVLLGFGALGMLPLAWGALAGFDPAAVSAEAWALGAFIVVFPTAGAYLLTLWALARADSSLVAFFIYLQPLMAATLSAIFLGERITPAMLAGAALVFAAVYLAAGRPAPAPSAALAPPPRP
jgi:drug/metabolite transporter (DMT)-like permease